MLEGGNKPTKNLVPLQCPDDSFNLNKIVLTNMKKSPYFLKLCSEVKNWSQAVDEIYYKADHLEQWSVGKFELIQQTCLAITDSIILHKKKTPVRNSLVVVFILPSSA